MRPHEGLCAQGRKPESGTTAEPGGGAGQISRAARLDTTVTTPTKLRRFSKIFPNIGYQVDPTKVTYGNGSAAANSRQGWQVATGLCWSNSICLFFGSRGSGVRIPLRSRPIKSNNDTESPLIMRVLLFLLSALVRCRTVESGCC